MSQFSINQVCILAGLNPPTLRMWEKRYGLFPSHREKYRERRYSAAQLNHLMILCLLCSQGIRISKLAPISPFILAAKLEAQDLEIIHVPYRIANIIYATLTLEIERIHKILNECFVRMDASSVIEEVIAPLIEFTCKSPLKSQSLELSLLNQVLKEKIIISIEKLPLPPQKGIITGLLNFLDPRFETCLLYIQYQLKRNFYPVIYLGTLNGKKVIKDTEFNPDLVICLSSDKKHKALLRDREFESITVSPDPKTSENTLWNNWNELEKKVQLAISKKTLG